MLSANPERGERKRWFEIPVVWLAALCLLVSLLGCIVNIVISLEYAADGMAEVAPSSRFQLTPVSAEISPNVLLKDDH